MRTILLVTVLLGSVTAQWGFMGPPPPPLDRFGRPDMTVYLPREQRMQMLQEARMKEAIEHSRRAQVRAGGGGGGWGMHGGDGMMMGGHPPMFG